MAAHTRHARLQCPTRARRRRRRWGRQADADELANLTDPPAAAARVFLTSARGWPGRFCLDLGYGTGRQTVGIARPGATLSIGVDFTPKYDGAAPRTR
jgi:predicted RNA methylase